VSPRSAIPLTPGGLGVVEVTLVAITVGFRPARPTAVLAVLGYRLVNYGLPLLPGAVAYLQLRLKQRQMDLPNDRGLVPLFRCLPGREPRKGKVSRVKEGTR
jgi:hypothetical protein